MTYTLIFKADKPYLRECATMEKPKPYNHDRFCEDAEYANQYQYEVDVYNQHLRSLPCYPLLNKPESWKEGMQIEDVMVRLQHQVQMKDYSWKNCDEESYSSLLDINRRIIFTPSEQPEKERGWTIHLPSAEQVGGGGEESDIDNDFIIKSIEIELNKMDKSNFGQVRKVVMSLLSRLTTPAAPSPGGLGDEDKVIICLNCKAFHFFGTWVCDRCGGKTFSAAHPSNKQFIEPVPGGLELAKEWKDCVEEAKNSVAYMKPGMRLTLDDWHKIYDNAAWLFLAGYASKGDGVELSQKEYNDLKRDDEQWRTHLKEIYKTK